MVSKVALVPLLLAAVAVAEDSGDSSDNAGEHAKGWTEAHKDDLTVSGCIQLVGMPNPYTPEGQAAMKIAWCDQANAPEAFGSIAMCLVEVQKTNAHAIDAFVNYCQQQHNATIATEDVRDAATNATQYLNATTGPLRGKEPVKYPAEAYTNAYKLALAKEMDYNYLMWFGIVLLSYWFVVCLGAGLCRLLFFVSPQWIRKSDQKWINAIRQHFTMAPLFGHHHAETKQWGWFHFVIPTRFELVIVLVFVVLMIAFNCSQMPYYEGDPFYESKSDQHWDLVAHRLGITSLFVMVPLILFAGRNNFLIWITGWPQVRFLYFHKWSARVFTVLILVHAGAYTLVLKGVGSAIWTQEYHKAYLVWGTVALVCMCLMCLLGVYAIRRLNYEVFLLLHIGMGLAFVVGGWRHVAETGYKQWFYAAAAIWAFDRFARAVRMLWFGPREAQVQLVEGATLKVTMLRPEWWGNTPGKVAFIHFLRPCTFWQSHPFTMVTDAVPGQTTVSFYIKVRGGMTHGLCRWLQNIKGQALTCPVLVDGPYGAREPLSRYDNAVMVAGGHGIPGMYSEARLLAQVYNDHTRVRLYWIIRSIADINWFYSEIRQLRHSRVETVIYITRPGDDTPEVLDVSSLESDDHKDKEKGGDSVRIRTTDRMAALAKRLPHVEFREGRPDCMEIVTSEVKAAQGTIAITSCGPGLLVDLVRNAVIANLNQGELRVDFYQQSQLM